MKKKIDRKILTIFFSCHFQKTPFAFTNPNSDLAAFYRECQNVPQLQSFNEETTLADQFGDLTKQLEDFETAAKHYEEELSTLCESENNN